MQYQRSVLIILAALCLGPILFAVCPEPVSCPIAFDHDPNQVTYRSLGSFAMTISETLGHDFTACDPDDDNGGFLFELVAGPDGMSLTADGHLAFVPTALGTFYADVMVTDVPIAGTPGADCGSIVIRVIPDNRPPIITGCLQAH